MENIKTYLHRIEQLQPKNITRPMVLKYIKSEKDLYNMLDIRYNKISYNDSNILKTIMILFENKFDVNYKKDGKTYLDVVLNGYYIYDTSKTKNLNKYSDDFIMQFVKLLERFGFEFFDEDGTPLYLSIIEKEKRDKLRKKLLEELEIIKEKNKINNLNVDEETNKEKEKKNDKIKVVEKENIKMEKKEQPPEKDFGKLKEIEQLKKEIIIETKKQIEIEEQQSDVEYTPIHAKGGYIETEEDIHFEEKTPEFNILQEETVFNAIQEPKIEETISIGSVEEIIPPSVNDIEPVEEVIISLDELYQTQTLPLEEIVEPEELPEVTSEKENEIIIEDTKTNTEEAEFQEEIQNIEDEIVQEIEKKELELEEQPTELEKEEIKETTIVETVMPDSPETKETEKILFTKEDEWKYLCDLIMDSTVYNEFIKYLYLVKDEEVTKALKEIKERENMIMLYTEYYKENIQHNISLDHIDKMAKMLAKTKKKFIKIPFEKEFDKIKLEYLKKLSYLKSYAMNANTLTKLKDALSMIIKFDDPEATKKIKRDVEYKLLEHESQIRKNKKNIEEIDNLIKILNLYGIPFTTDPQIEARYNAVRKLNLENVVTEELNNITTMLEDIKNNCISIVYKRLGNNIEKALDVLAILVTAKFISLMSAQNVFGQIVSSYGNTKQKIKHALPILSLTKKIHSR